MAMSSPREARLTNVYGISSLEYLIKLVSEHPELYKVSTRNVAASDQLPDEARKAWTRVMIQMRNKYGRELQDYLAWKSWRSLRLKYGSHSCAPKWVPKLAFLKEVIIPRKIKRAETPVKSDEEEEVEGEEQDSAYGSPEGEGVHEHVGHGFNESLEAAEKTPQAPRSALKRSQHESGYRKPLKRMREPFEQLLWDKWMKIAASNTGEERSNNLKRRIIRIVSRINDQNDAHCHPTMQDSSFR